MKTTTTYSPCDIYDNPTATAAAANADYVGDGGKITCKKPDLKVTKTGNGTINAGENVVFTIKVDNAGPGVAKAVKLSDNLPGGTAGDWVEDPENPNCSINAGALSCNFGDINSGDSRSVTVKAPTDADHCTTYDNTATATASNHPNARGDDTVNCVKPGLGVVKTAVQGTINAGEEAVFAIEVSNTGEGVATGVTLSDPLPAGVSGPWVEDPDNPACEINGSQLDCEFGNLTPGEKRTVTVKAPTDFENCTVLDNTATADASNAPEDSDSASITCKKPDLKVTKTGNGTINAGENVVFTIKVDNAGPGVAKAVTLNDLLPQGTAGPWAITTQPGGEPCSITDTTLSCVFGDLPTGQSRTVTVTAATDYENCITYDNSATAKASNAPQRVTTRL